MNHLEGIHKHAVGYKFINLEESIDATTHILWHVLLTITEQQSVFKKKVLV
jgi:hypothetical protein